MKLKKALSILLFLSLILTLFACNNDITEPPGEDVGTIVEIPEEPTPPPPPKFYNKLTGLEIDEELVNQRPVAVMFNNLRASLPQVGISSFDIVYEITTEGAITRLMGVATDWSSLPTIGSVRSSRDYFIDISDAHNAIYVHAGGSNYAYTQMWTRATERIDGTNGNSAAQTAFYRDPDRMKTMSLEHTLVTNGEKLSAAIEKHGFNKQYKDDFKAPLSFSQEEITLDGADATYIYIPFSTYAQAYLDYNTSNGLYSKGQYLGRKSSYDQHDSPHIDGLTGDSLKFKNVIILFAYHSGALDDKGRISVDLTGTGDGYYFCGGKCVPISWSKETRSSSYSLFNTDGSELLLSPGKTYVAIAPTGCDVAYK